jgi:hypothetical protein
MERSYKSLIRGWVMTCMSKVAILTCSLLVADVAIAVDWVKVVDFDSFTVYRERETTKVNGSVIEYWQKWEYKKIQEWVNVKPFKSVMFYTYTDCKKKTFGSTTTLYFDEMAKGAGVEGSPRHMIPIPPDTIIDGIAKIVCKPVIMLN